MWLGVERFGNFPYIVHSLYKAPKSDDSVHYFLWLQMRVSKLPLIGIRKRNNDFSKSRLALRHMICLSGWDQIHAKYIWNFGYKAESIFTILRSLTPRLDAALRGLLNRLQAIAMESTSNLALYSNHASLPPNEHQDSDVNELAWRRTSFGIMHLEFDPCTQCRSSVAVNPYSARLWGIRKDQMLEQIMQYDLPLPFSELDALRIFVVDLCRSFQDVTTQYVRYTVGDGMLVCITKLKVFDSLGRLTAVCHRIHAF